MLKIKTYYAIYRWLASNHEFKKKNMPDNVKSIINSSINFDFPDAPLRVNMSYIVLIFKLNNN